MRTQPALYLNEESATITSLNFCEFSQVINNEMDILIRRRADTELLFPPRPICQR